MAGKKKVTPVSTIPDVIIAKVGYKAILSINGYNYKVDSKAPLVLRPKFTEEVLNAATSIQASLANGWIIPYTENMELTKAPDLGFKIPTLRSQESFKTDVHFSVKRDAQDIPVITMGEIRKSANGAVEKPERVSVSGGGKKKSVAKDEHDVLKGEFLGEAPKFELRGFKEAQAAAESIAKNKLVSTL